jgi:hypothetical protein
MTDAWDLLASGNIFGSILQPYSTLIGLENFYMLLVGIACILIYMKSRNLGLVGLTIMLTGIGILPFVNPATYNYMFFVVVIGFGLAVYSMFKKD